MPRKSSNLLKRRLKIAELVGQQGEIKVDDLSALLDVSSVTIRGDLNYLEQQGYLKRSFGGAIATPAVPAISSQHESVTCIQPMTLTHQLEIARHCARLVSDGETLFLGHGEICRKVIPFLSGNRKLRVIVNDLQHALLAEHYIEGDIIVAGDELIRPHSLLSGKSFDEVIQRFTLDRCILEAGMLEENGDLTIDQPLLISHYQKCIDAALDTTAILNPVQDISSVIPPVRNLSQIKNLIACRVINEHYQQLLSDADFNIRYSNNECFTWSNRNLSED